MFFLLMAAAALVAFVDTTLAASPARQDTAHSAQQPVGDPEMGRQLFMGYQHLQNDGPPCMGCHSIGRNGLLGGGVLGPNLTNVSRLYPDLGQVLADIPWLTMKPIYDEHLLTPQEQVDLRAFLEASVGQAETDRELWVVGLSLAGTLAAAGAFGFLYRSRLVSVRRKLMQETKPDRQERKR